MFDDFDFGWPVEDPISQIQEQQGGHYYNTHMLLEASETSGGSLILGGGGGGGGGASPSSHHQPQHHHHHHQYDSNKKLNHNASERDRRKKINSLYASLRSLLPPSDHKKKLSIPATVSRVLKYIPELQKEVDRLVEKKQLLTKKMRKLDDLIRKSSSEEPHHHHEITSLVVSANRLGDREIVIQMSMFKSIDVTPSFAEALLKLEQQEGLLLLNMSTFESFEGRVFYNLHLQQGHGGTPIVVDIERIKENLLSIYENTTFLN